eukprot:9298461-Alexandrium_andersonii.AAC.1
MGAAGTGHPARVQSGTSVAGTRAAGARAARSRAAGHQCCRQEGSLAPCSRHECCRAPAQPARRGPR